MIIPFVIKLYFPLAFNYVQRNYNNLKIKTSLSSFHLQHLSLTSVFQIGVVMRFFKNASKKTVKISLSFHVQHLSIFSIFQISGVMRFFKNASKKALQRYGKTTVFDLERARTHSVLRKVAVESKKDDKNN